MKLPLTVSLSHDELIMIKTILCSQDDTEDVETDVPSNMFREPQSTLTPSPSMSKESLQKPDKRMKTRSSVMPVKNDARRTSEACL